MVILGYNFFFVFVTCSIILFLLNKKIIISLFPKDFACYERDADLDYLLDVLLPPEWIDRSTLVCNGLSLDVPLLTPLCTETCANLAEESAAQLTDGLRPSLTLGVDFLDLDKIHRTANQHSLQVIISFPHYRQQTHYLLRY